MLRELEKQVGPYLPERFWSGNSAELGVDASGDRGALLRALSDRMFGGRHLADTGAYEDIPVDTGLELGVWALNRPDLELLGYIGRDEQMVPAEFRPPVEKVSALRSVVLNGVGPHTCITNVNETGAFSQVDPADANLRELLLVFRSWDAITTLYWAHPIG